MTAIGNSFLLTTSLSMISLKYFEKSNQKCKLIHFLPMYSIKKSGTITIWNSLPVSRDLLSYYSFLILKSSQLFFISLIKHCAMHCQMVWYLNFFLLIFSKHSFHTLAAKQNWFNDALMNLCLLATIDHTPVKLHSWRKKMNEKIS